MEKMDIKNLEDRTRRFWQAGDQKSAIDLVDKYFDDDELEDTLNDLGFDYRDIVLTDLQGELQSRANELTDPEDDLLNVKEALDTIQDVQDRDDYIFDVSAGLMYARPITVDDFIGAIDNLVDDLGSFDTER